MILACGIQGVGGGGMSRVFFQSAVSFLCFILGGVGERVLKGSMMWDG